MSDTTLLPKNMIVRNASVGATPPHGSVKSGDLPLVQVKPPPVGPQVHEGQQKPMQFLPSKDPKGAVAAGGLPMVQVKMTQNGPKIDDGIDEPVVIKNNSRHGAVATGSLPTLQVKMTDAGPLVETLPNVQDGPPHIPSAATALSSPRGALPAGQGHIVRAAPAAHQGYVAPIGGHGRVARFAAPAAGQGYIARVAAPAPPLSSVPEFTTDQMMLLRHLADKYLGDLAAAEASVEASAEPAEPPVKSEPIRFVEATIGTIDAVLVAVAARVEVAAKEAAAAVLPPITTTPTVTVRPAPAARMVASPGTATIAPTPAVSYTAGRAVATRPHGGMTQRNAAMAPRRTARKGALPMVQVKMQGNQAVVQNQHEIDEALAAMEAQAAAAEAQAAQVAVAPAAEATEDPQR